MKSFSKYVDNLFFRQWIIGICRADISTILKDRHFDTEIKWFRKSSKKFYADPFFIPTNEEIKILIEEYRYKEDYGKIALLTLNNSFEETNYKTILDTKSHLSYPFLFRENSKYYVFPEAAQSGKLSCYEYNINNEELIYIQDIINLPLLDSTILKYNGKYWLFGTLGSNTTSYSLHVFFSDNLLGPYTSHNSNPVKTGLDSIRSAGNFLVTREGIFRPAQNCLFKYGESITINKIKILNEREIIEEEHMKIEINKLKKNNYGIQTIHTLNVMGDVIVIDGIRRFFSPLKQIKKILKDKFKYSAK